MPPLSVDKPLPPFAALRAFDAVGAERGIRKAAATLQIDHAAVARHIRNLESWLGVELLDRTRDPAFFTAAGESFYGRVSAALQDMRAAVADIMKEGDDSRLFVWCVPGFALHWLVPRLADFHRAHPDIQVELRPSDFPPDLSRHEADIDIRYVLGAAPGLSGKVRHLELARPEVFPVMSPELQGAAVDIRCWEDLWTAPLILEADDSEWRAWFKAQGIHRDEPLPGIRLWHAHLCLDAARRKQGIALANAFLASEDLESGRLVRITPPTQGRASVILGAYTLMANSNRWSKPAVARFRRWLYLALNKTPG